MACLIRASTVQCHTLNLNGLPWRQCTRHPSSSSDQTLPFRFPRLTTKTCRKKLEFIPRSSSQEHAPPSTGSFTSSPEPKLELKTFSLSTASKLIAATIFSCTVVAIALVLKKSPRSVEVVPANSHQLYLLKDLHNDPSAPTLPSANPVLQPSSHNDAANELEGGAQGMWIAPIKRPSSARTLFFASTTLSGNDNSKASKDTELEFPDWIATVKGDAASKGVSEQVLEWALHDVTISVDSVTHRKTEPEKILTVDAYLKRALDEAVILECAKAFPKLNHMKVYRMVNETRVSQGVTRLKANSELLTEISKKYGVPSQFLVSIWGIETNYGSYMGESDIIQALATMGYTEEMKSRRTYFRGELLEALVMLEKGTAQTGTGPHGSKRLRGSWAGAMGQCQFMPTSFRDYAVDYDGDGRRDIWESKADIFASIANYFKAHGWKDGGPIFQKVHVPKKLDKSLVDLKVVKSVEDWDRLHGITLDPGSAPRLPRAEMASLVMPDGPKGEAYLLCENFRVIMRYNSRVLYGFAVCELARLIQERASTPYPTPPLCSSL